MTHEEALELEVHNLRMKIEGLNYDLDARTKERDDAIASARAARLILHDVGFEMRSPNGQVVPTSELADVARNMTNVARLALRTVIRMHKTKCEAPATCPMLKAFEGHLATLPHEGKEVKSNGN